MSPRVAEQIPERVVKHNSGLRLASVSGHWGCYVRIEVDKEYAGSASYVLLTPAEAHDLAYKLRAAASEIQQGRDEIQRQTGVVAYR